MSNLKNIINIFNNNGLVAIPTDTIYGACGNPESEIAVNKLYELKKREKKKHLSIFVNNYSEIEKICQVSAFAKDFIYNKLENNTIILPKKDKNYLSYISDENIGIRVPNNDFLINLLKEYEKPIFATSINISGEDECLYYQDVYARFKNDFDLIVKNDTTPSNKSSSIYKIVNDKIEKIR
ncbi:MAG: L-threonylcarbamoyladenylate synthase [Rickettsiales bacterium]|nr:MAG: L-threonylcarbamoyladenylate synthase [Rickettsiales bacterium]